jgi:hypothetical protein
MEPAMSQDTPAPPPPPPPPAAEPDPVREPVPDAAAVADSPPDAEPAADAAAGSEDEPVLPVEGKAVRRRRGRTAVLIAVAAVLGVLGGVGAGYGIQYQREATPLPPLVGAMPVQPKGAAPDAPALPASQDRAAVFDGNLLDRLMPIPKGAKDSEREWVTLPDYAEYFDDPAGAFNMLAGDDFRRSVIADWTAADDTYYEIHMIQFRDDADALTSQVFSQWAPDSSWDPQYGQSVQIPDATNGYAYPSGKAVTKDGYEPYYEGYAIAQVGNILVDVYVEQSHPVAVKTVLSAINKQLERL